MNGESADDSNWRRLLDSQRGEIDHIDGQIISLLSKRQRAAAEIGKVKRNLGIEIQDPAREREILRQLTSRNDKDLSEGAIRTIFSEIMSAARAVQKDLTVGYLGPEATFNHQAALSLYGRLATFRPADTIEEVFRMVENGVCQQGVVPIENSYEGSVNMTLDMLRKYELRISAERLLRIRHQLLSRAVRLNEINRVYSHPMAIAQCHPWLKANLPSVPVKEVTSTSLAAKMASQEPQAAAVGSRLAGETYGLNTVKENIEDDPANVTRFIVIGKSETGPTGKDKTSLLLSLNHRPGALYVALEPVARRGINMLRIESRPMKTRNWEYLFFVDLEGHAHDPNVDGAITEMQNGCAFVKRLGSYPIGGEPWD
ncbi:MAG: prephenate dehydratase [Pseudomonadota bacterium]